MTFRMKSAALFFSLLLLATVAPAQSPREQFQQMVEQLQKNPSDSALRERIIKLAQELKPAPAVPEEAERRMARGMAAFKGAKSAADFQDAAKEFEQATLAAPWYGDAYFNLGVALDKAENYVAALRSLKLAQLASPEVREIKALIYEVEYRNEKANSPEMRAAKRKQQAQDARQAVEEMIRGLEGVEFVRKEDFGDDWGKSFFSRIRGGRVEGVDRQSSLKRHCLCGSDPCNDAPVGTEKICTLSSPFVGRVAELRDRSLIGRYEISDDGREIVLTYTSKFDNGERTPEIVERLIRR